MDVIFPVMLFESTSITKIDRNTHPFKTDVRKKTGLCILWTFFSNSMSSDCKITNVSICGQILEKILNIFITLKIFIDKKNKTSENDKKAITPTQENKKKSIRYGN